MDRHIILTLGRSGSNTLRDMLNQSPHILNFGEVLGDWNGIRKAQRRLPFLPRSDEAFLDWVLMSDSFPRLANGLRSIRKRVSGEGAAAKPFGGIQSYGIKDFSLNFERCKLTGYLAQRPGIKVIGLIREDVVDRMISNAMLGATGVVAARGGQGGGKRLMIDPAGIAALLADIETENAGLDRMLAGLPPERVRVVRYDDLFSDAAGRQAVMAGVFAFLGVPAVTTEERMSKIIRLPVSEVIENFEACLQAVRGTPHEALLRAAAARG